MASLNIKAIGELVEQLRKEAGLKESGGKNKPTEKEMATATGNTLNETGPAKVSAADVVHRGEQVILPVGMTLPVAIDLLQRRMEYMAQKVNLTERFNAFPWDGAAALERVLIEKYGWAPQVGFDVKKMFGGSEYVAPQMIGVEVALGQFRQIPWGRFNLPNIPGWVHTSMNYSDDGRICFCITAETKRSHEDAIKDLFSEVHRELRDNSIYRGKAVRVRFRDDEGEQLDMPVVKFIDTDVDQNSLVYSKHIEDAIDTNLFTPLDRYSDLEANGIPFKRGILLGGKFGTGKTLAAKVTSKKAVDAGITFIYAEKASEMSDALAFAKMYQSPAAVLFCEDIDRAISGERSVEMDDILNIIDGIDSKNGRIMVVLTTNDVESINPAMLRPGRLDAVINVEAPDAEAVQRLLRVLCGDALQPGEDLRAAAAALSGQIPAVITEAVKRARLAQLRRQQAGEPITNLSGDALTESARTMREQVELLNKPRNKPSGVPLRDLLVRMGDGKTEPVEF